MKQVSELKQGDEIYNNAAMSVERFRYLCVHPGSKEYSVLINGWTQEPLRMYNPHLQEILNKNLNTYDEARLALADQLEATAKMLRED